MYFNDYEKSILDLPLKQTYEKEELMKNDFLFAKYRELEVYWAPFEYINKDAKVIILGITPGFTQMELAFNYVRNNIHYKDYTSLIRNAKNNASFGGTTMRKNLIEMLDGVGLHKHLNIHSSLELFGEKDHLLHTSSVLRYPVFIEGNNYTGSNPSMLKHHLLRHMIDELLVPELNRMKGAVIIPTGKAVSEVLRYLVDEKKISHKTILFDFPHPSGANGHRKKQYEENKEKFMMQLS